MKNRVLLNRLVVVTTLIFSLLLAFYCCLGTVNVQFGEYYSHSNNLLFLIENINVDLSKVNGDSSWRVPTELPLILTAIPFLFTLIFMIIRIVTIFKINKSKDDLINDKYGINSIKRLLIEIIVFMAFIIFLTVLDGKLTILGYLLFAILFVLILIQFFANKFLYGIRLTNQLNNSLILLSLGLVLFATTLGKSVQRDLGVLGVSNEIDFISPFTTRDGDLYRYHNPYNQLGIYIMTSRFILIISMIIYSFILCKHLPFTKKKAERLMPLIVITSLLFIFSIVFGLLTYIEALRLSKDGSLLNPIESTQYLFSLVLVATCFASIIILLVSKQIYRKENETVIQSYFKSDNISLRTSNKS